MCPLDGFEAPLHLRLALPEIRKIVTLTLIRWLAGATAAAVGGRCGTVDPSPETEPTPQILRISALCNAWVH